METAAVIGGLVALAFAGWKFFVWALLSEWTDDTDPLRELDGWMEV